MTYVRQLALLAGLSIFGFAIYVLLFWAGIGAWITILFYRGMGLAFVAAIAVVLAAIWLARRTGDTSLPIAAASLSLSLNLCFLVLLPVTVDRSVTVYLLSTIEKQQQAGINARRLEQAFVDGYVVKMGAIDRRIEEQRVSGNIEVDAKGKVRLTRQGRRFMDLSRCVARLFGTDPRFVGAQTATPDSSRGSSSRQG